MTAPAVCSVRTVGIFIRLLPIVLLACGTRDASETTGRVGTGAETEGAPAASLAPVQTPTTTPPPAAPCSQVGYSSLPPEPNPEARRLNREGLSLHEEGNYEASAAHFERALELAPGFGYARLNLACAKARLGRHEEAESMLRALLCVDLPTFAQRVLADPDLAPLREGEAIQGVVTRIAAQYDEAADGGAPLVAYEMGPTPEDGGIVWLSAQAGSFQAEAGRFIPMGPRLRQRDGSPWGYNRGYAGVATRYDPRSGRAWAITFVDNDSEGGAPMVRTVVRLFRAPTGEAMIELPIRDPDQVRVGLMPDGLLVERESYPDERRWRVTTDGREPSSAPMTTPFLAARGFTLGVDAAPTGFRIANGRLITPGGSHVLGRGHRTMRQSQQVLVSADGRYAIVSSSRLGDCGSADRHVIDRVDLTAGTVVRVREGQGVVRLELLEDGALYLQIEGQLLRYPSIAADQATELSDWLILTPQPRLGNPMC